MTINQVTYGNPIINLAEVQLYSKGVQIPASSLTFVLSSIYNGDNANYSASNCNDGILSDFCHSATGDNSPTLTIYSPSAVDQIVVTNRQDCCQYRIAGATITVSQNGVQVWQSTFVGIQNVYTFNIGMLSVYGIYIQQEYPTEHDTRLTY